MSVSCCNLDSNWSLQSSEPPPFVRPIWLGSGGYLPRNHLDAGVSMMMVGLVQPQRCSTSTFSSPSASTSVSAFLTIGLSRWCQCQTRSYSSWAATSHPCPAWNMFSLSKGLLGMRWDDLLRDLRVLSIFLFCFLRRECSFSHCSWMQDVWSYIDLRYEESLMLLLLVLLSSILEVETLSYLLIWSKGLTEAKMGWSLSKELLSLKRWLWSGLRQCY